MKKSLDTCAEGYRQSPDRGSCGGEGRLAFTGGQPPAFGGLSVMGKPVLVKLYLAWIRGPKTTTVLDCALVLFFRHWEGPARGLQGPPPRYIENPPAAAPPAPTFSSPTPALQCGPALPRWISSCRPPN